ncbi:MAG: serine/threonine protein kinase [Myxococcales bacterium]|nr:serine/threonine protein kinase [Myxococcales bacterium]
MSDGDHDPHETLPGRPDPGELAARLALAQLRARMFQASVPVEIGRYRLLHLLGRGAQGRVFEAEDGELRRTVALKVLRPDDPTPTSRPRLREARALARLSHPHVIEIYDVGLTEDELWIAMELVRGDTVAGWAQQHPPGSPGRFERLRAILDQAAAGVAAAHERGLVHRDLKPSNVLVGDDGRVRVADFGLARPRTTDTEPLAAGPGDLESPVTAVAGTPRYMSPEQLRGEPVDAASDQFGFAVMAWELVVGTHPFAGLDPAALARADELRPVPAPRPADVPPAYLRALRRALAPDPADRFASMEELRRALWARSSRRWIAGATVGAAALAIAAWLAIDRAPTPTAPAEPRDVASEPAAASAHAPSSSSEPPPPHAPPDPLDPLSLRLADARAELELGRYATAIDKAAALAADATQARQGTLAADAHEVVGIAWGELQDPRRFAAFEAAYYAAAELTDGRDLARHANSLAMQHAYQGELDQTEAWARHAEAGLRRHPDELQRLRLQHVRGLVQLKRGELTDATATFEGVLEQLGDRDPATDELAWLAGLALVATHRAAGRSDEVTALAEHLRRRTLETLGPSHPRLARLSMALASSARKQGELDQAIAHLEDAVRLSQQGYGPASPRTSQAYLELGYTYVLAGDPIAAEQSYQRGLAAAGETDGPYRVRLLRGLAAACSARDDPGGAEARLHEAVSVGRRVWPEGSLELSRTTRDLAEALLERGAVDEATHHLRAALEGLGSSPDATDLARMVVDLDRAQAAGAELPELPALREQARARCGAAPSSWCRGLETPRAASGAQRRQ